MTGALVSLPVPSSYLYYHRGVQCMGWGKKNEEGLIELHRARQGISVKSLGTSSHVNPAFCILAGNDGRARLYF